MEQVSDNLTSYAKAKSLELGIKPPTLVLKSFKGWQVGGGACYHALWHQIMIDAQMLEAANRDTLKAVICHELIHAKQRRETLLVTAANLIFSVAGLVSLMVFLFATIFSADPWVKAAFGACMALLAAGYFIVFGHSHFDRITEAKELEADRHGALLFGDRRVYIQSMASLWEGEWPPSDRITNVRFQAMGLY